MSESFFFSLFSFSLRRREWRVVESEKGFLAEQWGGLERVFLKERRGKSSC